MVTITYTNDVAAMPAVGLAPAPGSKIAMLGAINQFFSRLQSKPLDKNTKVPLIRLCRIVRNNGRTECSCLGKKADTPGKHPIEKWDDIGNGVHYRCWGVFERALTTGPNPAIERPGFNFAICAGLTGMISAAGTGCDLVGPNGLFVIDVDARHGGLASYERLRGMFPELDGALRVAASGGGFHIYCNAPACVDPIKGLFESTKIVLKDTFPGIDFKSGKTYLVTPGSEHKSGIFYAVSVDAPLLPIERTARLIEILQGCPDFPKKEPVAPPPATDRAAAAAAAIARGESLDAHVRNYLDTMAPSIEGQNGSGALFRAAGVLVNDFALDFDTALTHLRYYNDTKASPPWSEAELERKLRDAAAKRTGQYGRLLNSASDVSSKLPRDVEAAWTKYAQARGTTVSAIKITWGAAARESQRRQQHKAKRSSHAAPPHEPLVLAAAPDPNDRSWFRPDVSPAFASAWCPKPVRVVLQRGKEAKTKCIPCRKLHCPVCCANVKRHWILSAKHHFAGLGRGATVYIHEFIASDDMRQRGRDWGAIRKQLHRKRGMHIRLWDAHQSDRFWIFSTVDLHHDAIVSSDLVSTSDALGRFIAATGLSKESHRNNKCYVSCRRWSLMENEEKNEEDKMHFVGVASLDLHEIQDIAHDAGAGTRTYTSAGKFHNKPTLHITVPSTVDSAEILRSILPEKYHHRILPDPDFAGFSLLDDDIARVIAGDLSLAELVAAHGVLPNTRTYDYVLAKAGDHINTWRVDLAKLAAQAAESPAAAAASP